ncbi:MAG: hypothetical protein QNK05_09715 [Myxococcota bacterium]|nr:hypothetical protein [Myxococcota bacterium]
MSFRLPSCLALVALLLLASSPGFGFAILEAVDGDLSDDIAAPTPLGPLSLGSNLVVGEVVDATGPAGDVDVFTFSVPAGSNLSKLLLVEFESADDLAFVAIASGATFPVDPNTLAGPGDPLATSFLGGLLFGAGPAAAGADLLPLLAGAPAGGSGFTAPLGAGDYTVFVQQLGGLPVEYYFNLVGAPVAEPAGLSLLGLALVGVARRRR